MADITSDHIRQVLGYLADRNRSQCGCWISVADVRGALGFDRAEVEVACRRLGDHELAEFMGGFPLRLTRERFTLVRLTERGSVLAGDEARLDETFGAGN